MDLENKVLGFFGRIGGCINASVNVYDRAVKLTHDAAAASVYAATGIDRYSLGRFAMLGGATSQLVAAGILGSTGYFALGVTVTPIPLMNLLRAKPLSSEFRSYFTSPRDVLNADTKLALGFSRGARLFFLPFAGMPYMMPDGGGSLGMVSDILWGMGFLAFASSCYFFDGDHTHWQKAVNIAKAAYKRALELKPDFRPGPTPSPEPVPVPSFSRQQSF